MVFHLLLLCKLICVMCPGVTQSVQEHPGLKSILFNLYSQHQQRKLRAPSKMHHLQCGGDIPVSLHGEIGQDVVYFLQVARRQLDLRPAEVLDKTVRLGCSRAMTEDDKCNDYSGTTRGRLLT